MTDPADKKPARRRGRPAYEPTAMERAQAKQLAALLGGRLVDIAKVLQVSVPTLRKYFGAEIALGNIEANAKVAQSLFRQATNTKNPSVAAAIFWLKARAGWSDNGARAGAGRAKAVAKPGKKEAAATEARTAQKGTEWDEILPQGQERTLQ